MELRRRSTIHFIQTIKNGTVVKMSNLESQKKPSFVFKALEDIYKDFEPDDLGISSKSKWKDTYRKLVLNDGVKVENSCVPSVDRKTREVGNSDKEESDDLNFASITLKQIKEKCTTKKRKKGSDCYGLSPEQECTKLESEEDELDLMEPLFLLKSRIAKSPKFKRKCTEKTVSSASVILAPVKAEPGTVDNDYVQCNGDILTVSVKVEDPLPELTENPIAQFGTTDSTVCVQQERSGEVLEDSSRESQNVKSISITCAVVSILSQDDLEPIHDNNVEAVEKLSCEAQNVKPVSMTEQYGICSLNSLSYEHLLPVHDDTEVSNQGKMEQDSSDVNALQIEDECVKHSSLSDDSEVESSSKNQSNFEVQVSTGSSNNGGSHCRGEVTKELPSSNLSPSLGCQSSVVSELVLQSPSLNTGTADTCSYSESKIVVDGDTRSESLHINEENNSTMNDDTISDLPTSEVWHQPERLPATRKAIAPTSEERLLLSVNSMETDNETSCNKCESGEDDRASSELTESPQKQEQVFQTKATKPNGNLKKFKKFRRGSPPKRNHGGSPSFTRFSTGCTSLKVCSESAITFSQRQMHDIEQLANTLMAELKSVKEVVEEKLLFEAYRNPTLKNGADEVKSVIKNATRAEVTSKRWLALMSRDCNRFCKIMKLKDNEATTPSPENPIKRQKKITFADETGGTLCHVKLFENYVESSVESNKSETNESQAEFNSETTESQAE